MATYRELVGKKIKKVTSDPSTGIDGQMWYNSTTGAIRGLAVVEAFSSASPLATARYSAAFAGPQTANFVAAGAPGNIASTEEYNGSGFSAGGDVNQGRDGAVGAGTIPAGLIMGGIYPGTTYVGLTEEYDGSSWSEVTNLSQARGYANGGGIQTAAWLSGGRQGPPYSNPSQTEEYDGTNWTSGGALATNTRTGCYSGPQTAAWIVGGTQPNDTDLNSIYQEYDGSTWTNGPSNPTAITNGGGSGTQTVAVAFGVQTGPAPNGATTVFKYDGTTWAVSPATLGTARRSVQKGMGPSGAEAICAGGRSPGALALTEEYNSSTNVITAAAWSSGGNLNTARYQFAGAGSTPAGLVFGGRKETAPSANYNNSEEYDGTSWTEGNNLNTARFGLYGIGTQTAGLACGGRSTPAVLDSSEEYDGTSYTEGNNLASARHAGASAGTQTAGLIFKGTNVTAPGPANMTTTSQSYDGTSWTATNSCNTAGLVNYGFGTQTAAISVGGNPFSTSGESFDGTNWTAISGTLNDGRQQGFSGGTSTNGLVCGGNTPPNTTNVEAYNGTIFTTAPSLSTARRAMAGTPGTSVPAGIFGAGGYTSTELNSTEEFTPESITGNVKTFSTS